MSTVTVYSQPGCHLCEQALEVLWRLQAEHRLRAARSVDITDDEALHRAYFERIPVIALDGEELCEYFVDEPSDASRRAASRVTAHEPS